MDNRPSPGQALHAGIGVVVYMVFVYPRPMGGSFASNGGVIFYHQGNALQGAGPPLWIEELLLCPGGLRSKGVTTSSTMEI